MDILQNILGFVVAIGVLVAFHEYGHFWVARRLGVKVLRYSIGFGKPLWTWRRGADETEYVISAIPLGGYVKMLDEREGEVDPSELHPAFNRKPVAVRTAIVAAGPIFNFLFALACYWLVFVVGSEVVKPVVGEVLPETPAAAAGFEPGDQLIAVGRDEVNGWEQALLALVDASVSGGTAAVDVRRADGSVAQRELDMSSVGGLDPDTDFLGTLGFRPWVPELPPRIGQVLAGSPAEEAGLRAGDLVRAVEGIEVGDWEALVAEIRARPGAEVALRVDQAGVEREVRARLAMQEQGGERIGSLGVAPEIPEDLYAGMTEQLRYGPLAAVAESAQATWQASLLTLKVLWQMLIGEASLKNLSGPLNIAQYAGESVGMGVLPFLKFLAIVSISLGVLNLLPVPVLDGGHLLYYGVEAVRGRPLSDRAQQFGQEVGIVLLGLLMVVAFYNDIVRLTG